MFRQLHLRMNFTKKAGVKGLLIFVFLSTILYWILVPGDFVCPPKMLCLCVQINNGGLGNRLYKLTTAYSFARSKGMKFYISGGDKGLTSTFHLEGIYESTWSHCTNLYTVKETVCCKYLPNVLDIPAKTSITMKGYFQSFKYFERYKKDIKRILTFREDILHDARMKLDSALKENYGCDTKCKHFHRTLVGIHIRRGDYTKQKNIEYGYRAAPKEYIIRAQNYMRSHFPNVTFIVCTNGLEWSRDVFLNQKDVIIIPMGSAEVDMALLSLMNHMIMTVGTYGYWSAWLNQNNGTVIYYKDFYEPNTKLGKQFANPNTDTYYPHWIGM